MTQSEKKELLSLVPQSIKTSKSYTETCKILLGYLINLNGMDKAINNGYFFKTNADIINDLGITEQTLIRSLNILISNGIISRKSGKRGEASEYRILLENVNHSINHSNQIIGINHSNNSITNHSNNHSNDIELNYLILNELKKHTILLKNIYHSINHSNTNHSNNHSTDTEEESELDIDKELNNNINIIGNSIKEFPDNNNINNILEEKLPVEENEVEVSNDFSINEEIINAVQPMEVELPIKEVNEIKIIKTDSNLHLESVNEENVSDNNITAESNDEDSATNTNDVKNNIIPLEVTLKLGKEMNQTQYNKAHEGIDKLMKCKSIEEFNTKLELFAKWISKYECSTYQYKELFNKIKWLNDNIKPKLPMTAQDAPESILTTSNEEVINETPKVQEISLNQAGEASNNTTTNVVNTSITNNVEDSDEFDVLDEMFNQMQTAEVKSNVEVKDVSPTKDTIITEFNHLMEVMPNYDLSRFEMCFNGLVNKYDSSIREFKLLDDVENYQKQYNEYFIKNTVSVEEEPVVKFTTKALKNEYYQDFIEDCPTPIEDSSCKSIFSEDDTPSMRLAKEIFYGKSIKK